MILVELFYEKKVFLLYIISLLKMEVANKRLLLFTRFIELRKIKPFVI